jgi:hypothetical protein
MSSDARYAAMLPIDGDAALDAALDDVLAHDFGSELTRLRSHAKLTQLRSVAGGPDESVETQRQPRGMHRSTSDDQEVMLARDSNAVPSVFHPE